MVQRILWAKLHDESTVEDVYQSAVLKCFAKLDQFRFAAGFGTWFTQVALNEMKQLLRKERALERNHVEYSIEALRKEPVETITNALARRQQTAILRETLESLPPRYREVMLLRHFHGLSLTDLSRRLDLSRPTVKSRLHRGLRMAADRVKARLDLAA
jgi:RNA polymerase sigma-70 factor (ECF subfamily)